MYLKYVPSGTKVVETIRDITHMIHDSSTGIASLANLEFCSTGASSFTAGANSGWSLASGYTLGSGTTGSGDAQYALVADSDIGTNKKYCSLHSNGDWGNSSEYNGTYGSYASGYGWTLSGLLDYGLGTQMYSHGRTSTSASYSGAIAFSYYPTSGYPATFHVFAAPKYIVIAGATAGGHFLCQGVVELEDNFMTADARSTISHAVPHCFFQMASYGPTGGSTSVQSRYRGDANSHTDQGAGPGSFRQFFQCIKDRAGNTARAYVSGCGREGSTNTFRMTHTQENSTTTGSTSPASTLGAFNAEEPFYRYMGIDTRQTLNPANRWNFDYATFGRGYGNRLTKNAAGNADQIPLFPLVHSFDHIYGGMVINLSKYMPLYVAPYDLGSSGDTFTVGSDTYIYLGGSWPNGYRTGYMMKVE